MEVRCVKCNKLFRVSDDKITGSGIKFGCTRCRDVVKITRADFEQYMMSKTAAAAVTPVEPAPVKTGGPAPRIQAKAAPESSRADIPDFDLNSLKAAAGVQNEEKKAPPVFSKPSASVYNTGPVHAAATVKEESAVYTEAKHQTAAAPKPETKIAAKPKQPAPAPEPAAVSPASAPKEVSFPVYEGIPSPRSSSRGKKLALFLVALLIMGGAAFGAKVYLDNASSRGSDAGKELTMPDGLQIQNASGTVDPVSGDLVITGLVVNSTDKRKPAWFVVAEVYDAQGTVLIKGKLLNGKQLYTRRDYDIMAKRGANVQEIKQKSIQDQGVVIPQNGSVSFEIRIMEPPVGVASFNVVLQPFDPVQLYKQIAEEQK